MKRLSFILILLAIALLAVACGGESGQVETTVADTTAAPESTALIEVEPVTVMVENPDWGFPAHSIEVADPDIVTAELNKNSGNVVVTSHHVGETEITVLDCFGHKASLKVKVAQNGNISYEATPCTEEFINALKYGITPGKTSSGLPDQTTKLQSLIDSIAHKGGGTIYLYPGFYNIKLISMRENITLKMYSGFTDAREGFTDELAEMVKKGEVTVLMVTRILSTDFKDYGRNSAGNFTLSGGVIDNNHSTQSTLLFGLSENIVIENMIFKDIKNNHVIQITGSDNVTIKNCIFAGFEWGDTFTRETIQIEQSHPGAHSSDHANAPQRFDYGEMYGCDNITIDACYFGPSDELPGAHIAIGHHGTAHEPVADNFKITNNVFDRPTYSAIRFASITNVEITGNTFIATKDSNKFCNESDPAFIILYSNTSDVTYTNIVDGQKVTKAFAYEQSGTHHVDISNNTFSVEKGSDKRIIIVTGTSVTPGAMYKNVVLRQETYDRKPYKLTGYLRATNYIGDVSFTDNTVTYSGQPSAKDYIFRFQSVYGLKFENNTISLESCSFGKKDDGIMGLSKTGVKNGVDAQTYVIQAGATSKSVILPHANGTAAKLVFTLVANHNVIASEGGRLEISDDGNGNVTFTPIADEGYVFDGWTTASGALTADGTVKINEKTTFTANFKKK